MVIRIVFIVPAAVCATQGIPSAETATVIDKSVLSRATLGFFSCCAATHALLLLPGEESHEGDSLKVEFLGLRAGAFISQDGPGYAVITNDPRRSQWSPARWR